MATGMPSLVPLLLHPDTEPESLFQVQKEALARSFANKRFEQPYQTALYTSSVLHELKRWHISEYEAVIGGLSRDDLQVNQALQPMPLQSVLDCKAQACPSICSTTPQTVNKVLHTALQQSNFCAIRQSIWQPSAISIEHKFSNDTADT